MHYVALFGFVFKIIGKILQLYATIKYICTITIKKPNNYEKIITDFIFVFFSTSHVCTNKNNYWNY